MHKNNKIMKLDNAGLEVLAKELLSNPDYIGLSPGGVVVKINRKPFIGRSTAEKLYGRGVVIEGKDIQMALSSGETG